jgi:flagellum-specific ATP synthase
LKAEIDTMFLPFSSTQYHDLVNGSSPIRANGRVQKIVGLVIEASGPASQIGCVCDITTEGGMGTVCAEVLGFKEDSVLLMPLEDIRSIGPGCKVTARKEKAQVGVGKALLGRVIDGLGNPIDDKGPISLDDAYPVYANPVNPLLRNRIQQPLDLGIRAINGLLTVGCGQRMGIFAGSGVGKSVLLGMIARNTSAEVNVIASDRRAGQGTQRVYPERSWGRGAEKIRCCRCHFRSSSACYDYVGGSLQPPLPNTSGTRGSMST